jgi:hypothetical protein
MIKASKLAIVIAVVGPLAVATVGESFAAPVSSSAAAVKAAAPPAATDVQYVPNYYGYGPYAYRPAYKYGGYTYWYPTYPYWDSNTWNTGNGYY